MSSGLLSKSLSLGVVVAVKIDVGDSEEEVVVDPVKGPRVHQVDGSTGHMIQPRVPLDYVHQNYGPRKDPAKGRREVKLWSGMTSTEQQVLILMAAKKNRNMREWKGTEFFSAELAAWAADVAAGAASLPDEEEQEEEQECFPGETAGPVPVDEELRQQIEEQARVKLEEGAFGLHCLKYNVLGFPLANPKLRVICFHNAGSAESTYTAAKTPFMAWAQDTGAVEIVAPDYPGRGKLLKAEKHTSIDSLAPELLAVLHEKLADGVPYIVWSHSVGTWVAFEFLILARKVGLPMPLAALFMAFPAPHMPESKRKWHRSAKLGDPQLKGELLNWDKGHFKGAGKVVFDYPFWGRDWEPLMRADFRLFDEYVFRHDGFPKFDFPIHSWHFSEEHYNEAWMIQMWMDWTIAEFDYRVMKGIGHLTCFYKPDLREVYFKQVTEVLQSYIA